jgi:N-acetylglucosaminyldiphosphoundecaprenol N-acetyl-beta-D-mannosaminyltransferase
LGRFSLLVFTLQQAREVLMQSIQHNTGCKQIVIANAWSVVLAYTNPLFCQICKQADYTFADGQSIVYASYLFKNNLPERVAGPDFMWPFLQDCQQNNVRCFFLGATPHTLSILKNKVTQSFPNVWAGEYSPPFGEWPEHVHTDIVSAINHSNAQVLWVGVGSPKQDIWIQQHKHLLNCKLAFGVGAAFDFYSGTIKRAPLWMQKYGLEWLHRLFSDPKRLWKRYLYGNFKFMLIVLKQRFFMDIFIKLFMHFALLSHGGYYHTLSPVFR